MGLAHEELIDAAGGVAAFGDGPNDQQGLGAAHMPGGETVHGGRTNCPTFGKPLRSSAARCIFSATPALMKDNPAEGASAICRQKKFRIVGCSSLR